MNMKLIDKITKNKRKTLVRVYTNEKLANSYQYTTIGEWDKLQQELKDIDDYKVETICVNSALDLLETKDLKVRIEYGAMIREDVIIEEGAVVLMGAVINTGCFIGKKSMIDMGAVLGGGVIVKENCHIGANAVLAGMIEPISNQPVIIERNCFIGAGVVVLEGVCIGEGSIIGANAVVKENIPPYSVAVGVPAKVIKKNLDHEFLVEDLRKL